MSKRPCFDKHPIPQARRGEPCDPSRDCLTCWCLLNKKGFAELWGETVPDVPAPVPHAAGGRLARAGRFARAMGRWAASGLATVSDHEQTRRRAICNSCPERNAADDTCRKCGCSLGGTKILPSKIAMATEECPLAKWGKAEPAPSMDLVQQILAVPNPHPAGSRWAHEPGVYEAFREAFGRVCHTPPPPYPGGTGRGIVICAGGWRFLAGLYITVRFLRHFGCDWPVEAWYLGDHGEYDAVFEGITRGLDVRWRDAQAELRRRGIVRREPLEGWPLKPLAVMLSDFDEVLSLDADCYPTYHPEQLFAQPLYQERGAWFWPDNGGDKHGAPLEAGQWKRFGIAPRGDSEPDFETGQFIIHKSRCWHPLWATCWLNDRTEYVYGTKGGPAGIYGDKSTFHLAWRGCGLEYVMSPPVKWHDCAFLQRDLQGDVCFVHRCRDKPKLQRWEYCTRQQFPEGNKFSHGLPHEMLFHRFLGDFRKMMKAPSVLSRPAEGVRLDQAEQAYREIHLVNCYRLPERLDGAVVLDVGAQIGILSRACLDRGAAKVFAVEPHAPTLEHLQRNVAEFGDRAVIVPRCVGDPARPMVLDDSGDWPFARAGEGEAALGLDELIAQAGGKVDLLKIDAEGAEFPALFAATKLECVQRIAGEYHLVYPPEVYAGHEASLEKLREKLESAGFRVEFKEHIPGVGMFYAER